MRDIKDLAPLPWSHMFHTACARGHQAFLLNVSQDGILAAGTRGKCVSVWHTETCERIRGPTMASVACASGTSTDRGAAKPRSYACSPRSCFGWARRTPSSSSTTRLSFAERQKPRTLVRPETLDICTGEACRPWRCGGRQPRWHHGSPPQGRRQTERLRRQMLVPIVPRAVPRELGPHAWVGGLQSRKMASWLLALAAST